MPPVTVVRRLLKGLGERGRSGTDRYTLRPSRGNACVIFALRILVAARKKGRQVPGRRADAVHFGGVMTRKSLALAKSDPMCSPHSARIPEGCAGALPCQFQWGFGSVSVSGNSIGSRFVAGAIEGVRFDP